jgi:hypothetical protein
MLNVFRFKPFGLFSFPIFSRQPNSTYNTPPIHIYLDMYVFICVEIVLVLLFNVVKLVYIYIYMHSVVLRLYLCYSLM